MYSCSQSPQELPRYDLKKAPIHRGQGESEERNSPLQIGVWQFYWAKELTYEACLGWPQDKEFCTPACQILKVYIEVLTGISYIYIQIVLTPHFCLKAIYLGQLLGRGKASGTHIPRTEVRWGASDCWTSAHRITGSHIFSMTSPNNSVRTLKLYMSISSLLSFVLLLYTSFNMLLYYFYFKWSVMSWNILKWENMIFIFTHLLFRHSFYFFVFPSFFFFFFNFF